MSDSTHCYVGVLPGEVFGFIAVDAPDLAEAVAQDVQHVIQRGGRVDRMSIEEGRALVGRLFAAGDKP